MGQRRRVGLFFSLLAVWLSVRRSAMRNRGRKVGLVVLAGVLVAALLALVWAIETASSEAQQDAGQNGLPVSTLGMPNDMAGTAGDSEWTLVVDGFVESPLNLTFDDLVAMPATTVYAQLYCVGLPTTPLAQGNWTGVRLGFILEEAGVLPEAWKVAFYADGFSTDLPLTTAIRDDIILAYERDGEPLAEKQLVVPCKWGYKWIREPTHIELVDYDFLGTYESRGLSDEANRLPGDDDCDGFTTADEEYVGTDPLDDCPDVLGTPGLCPGPSCDGHDAWPPDSDIDRDADIVDVLKFRPYIMTSVPPSPQRFDFDADGDIDIVDIMKYKPLIMTSCTP